MLWLFCISTVLVAYTYVGYPCLVWILARLFPTPIRPASESSTPSVSIVIAVYNERARIERKLATLRRLAYEPTRMQRIFVSDGSTDGTNELLRAAHDVCLIECPRGGKAAAINAGVACATGEILVFTDVRQELAPDAVTHLVHTLSDPEVGTVSGELGHRDAKTGAAKSIGLYWRYERFIRTHESTFFSCVGASGALYAVRRKDFRALPPGTILDDFEVPMDILRRGGRIVLDADAKVLDDLESDLPGEHRRKVRTLTGNYQSFARHPWLFSPRQNPAWWQFVSHKVARLLVPYALVGAFVSAWLQPGAGFKVFAACQTAFYAIAVAAIASPSVRGSRLASAAGLFVETNVAAVVALWRFVRGDAGNVWTRDGLRR